MLLALDLGTKTGYAFQVGGGFGSGVLNLASRRFEGGGMRYLRFRQWLDEIGIGGVEAVYFEEVRRHLGTDAAHIYGGLLAVLSSWCESNKIPYCGVPVGTIKKFWTGKGNADKAAMIREAGARGFLPSDDNEADAIALLQWALAARGTAGAQEIMPRGEAAC